MTADELRDAMDAAAAALDFERAQGLRDRLAIARQTGTDPGDEHGLRRQQPGAMGIGTSAARPATPDGWQRPVKPDPMTRRTGRRK